MKKYLYSVLGTLTGIWLSVIIGFALLIVFAVSAASGRAMKSVEDNSVLRITFTGVATDRVNSTSPLAELYGIGDEAFDVNSVIKAINAAASDTRISGMIIDFQGVSIGLGQAEAVRAAIEKFRLQGKWSIAYSDNYTQTEFYIASAADEVMLNKIGMVDVHGLSATTIYFKDFLDKLGVEAQVVKVGTYKSAVEPFILNDMSAANREQQKWFLTRIWDSMSSVIAKSRHTTVDSVNLWANEFCFAQEPEFYERNGMVDGLCYRHEIDEDVASRTGREVAQYIEFDDYIASLNQIESGDVNIAVVYALGDITESGEDGIASEKYVPLILGLAEDKSVDGLILRVNSGGGSAFASEQIWEALEQYKLISGKPYYVSMSDMAASGGYYISCGADKIYAEPLTLTGSIGIFGIIPNVDGLLHDKLGINSFRVETNDGNMPDILKPMSPELKAAMQNYVNRGYRLFVGRCAKGRGLEYQQVAAVAEGRVWDGKSALEHGLVDKLGGLSDALEDMKTALHADSYTVTEYPKNKTSILDMLYRIGSEDVTEIQMSKKLGKAYEYYRVIERFSTMHPLQCRMEFITVE